MIKEKNVIATANTKTKPQKITIVIRRKKETNLDYIRLFVANTTTITGVVFVWKRRTY